MNGSTTYGAWFPLARATFGIAGRATHLASGPNSSRLFRHAAITAHRPQSLWRI